MTEKENNEGIGADLFDEVSRTINYDRQDQYGNPEDCFASIARRWTEYIRHTHPHVKRTHLLKILPEDVAFMMMELKMARESVNHKHDNIVDLCRYAALRDRMTDEQADTKDYTPIAPPKEDKPKCLGHPMKVNAHTDCSTCHVKLACIHTAASQKRRMDAINRPEL